MFHDRSNVDVNMSASATRRSDLSGGVNARGDWKVVCRDPSGAIKWSEEYRNIVFNEGLDHLLDVTLSGGSQITSWHVGLVASTNPTFAAADTTTSHGGWTESTNYSEGTRPSWTDNGVSGQSVDNSTSVASYSIDTNGSKFGGAFLTSSSNKGSSTTGPTLYAGGSFATVKQADNGDTLEVTATFTSADDGA